MEYIETNLETNLDRLGRRIRQVIQAETRPSDAIRRARSALLEEVGRRNVVPTYRFPSRQLGSRWLTLVLATVIGVGAAGLLWWTRPGSFHVGEGRGQLGDKIESPAGSSTRLRFSDGSAVLLHEGGRMRVLALDHTNTQVLVEDGAIDVSLARRKIGNQEWNFEAGPYHVQVIGTRFRMDFHASDQSIRLSADHGQVRVSGGCEAAPRTLSIGERAELYCVPGEGLAYRR